MQDKHEHRPKKHGRNLIMLLTGAAIVIGGAFAAHAVVGSKAYGHARMAAFDGGWQGGGMNCCDHKPLHEMTDDEIETRITRMVRHVSIEIDATPEQETRIIATVAGAAKELRPLRERMQATGMELQALLTADSIDREGLEALRASRLAEADMISKTLVAAVADVAEALTPEQRETLQQMIRERRARHHRR